MTIKLLTDSCLEFLSFTASSKYIMSNATLLEISYQGSLLLFSHSSNMQAQLYSGIIA